MLPSTPYTFYPPSCHFFVVIPSCHLPPIDHTLRRATFLWLSPCCHLPPIDHTLRRATSLWLSPRCHLPPIDHTLRRANFCGYPLAAICPLSIDHTLRRANVLVIPHILCMTHPFRNPQTRPRASLYPQSRTRTSGTRTVVTAKRNLVSSIYPNGC